MHRAPNRNGPDTVLTPMSTLAARVKISEAQRRRTIQLRAMTDEQLKRIVLEYLIAATPEEIETDLVEHSEFRELYEELLPRAREQREAVESLQSQLR